MQHADRDTRWMLAGGAVLAIAVVCGSLALAGVRLDDRDAARAVPGLTRRTLLEPAGMS